MKFKLKKTSLILAVMIFMSVFPSMISASYDDSPVIFTVADIKVMFPEAALDEKQIADVEKKLRDEGVVPESQRDGAEPVYRYEKRFNAEETSYLNVYSDGSYTIYGTSFDLGQPNLKSAGFFSSQVYAAYGTSGGSASTSGGVTTVTGLNVYYQNGSYWQFNFNVNYKYTSSSANITSASMGSRTYSLVLCTALGYIPGITYSDVNPANQSGSTPAKATCYMPCTYSDGAYIGNQFLVKLFFTVKNGTTTTSVG